MPRCIRIVAFKKGGARENRPPRGVEKRMLIFGGKVTERSPERELLLGDRPASGLRQERSVRDRKRQSLLVGVWFGEAFLFFPGGPANVAVVIPKLVCFP